MTSSEPRKLFSKGEWLTLAGMGLAVVSAALVWGMTAPEISLPGAIGEIYRSRLSRTEPGFEMQVGWLRVGWIVVICAVGCGCLLLFEPGMREKRRFFVIQCVLASIILGFAFLHIGLYPGPIMSGVGGLLLIWGAFQRYR